MLLEYDQMDSVLNPNKRSDHAISSVLTMRDCLFIMKLCRNFGCIAQHGNIAVISPNKTTKSTLTAIGSACGFVAVKNLCVGLKG